ncbi:hypothetical protein [Staphylococcus argenteus]
MPTTFGGEPKLIIYPSHLVENQFFIWIK